MSTYFQLKVCHFWVCDKGGGGSRRMANKCDMGGGGQTFRYFE